MFIVNVRKYTLVGPVLVWGSSTRDPSVFGIKLPFVRQFVRGSKIWHRKFESLKELKDVLPFAFVHQGWRHWLKPYHVVNSPDARRSMLQLVQKGEQFSYRD